MTFSTFEFRCVCGEKIQAEYGLGLLSDYESVIFVSFRGEQLNDCPGCGRNLAEEHMVGDTVRMEEDLEMYRAAGLSGSCGTCRGEI